MSLCSPKLFLLRLLAALNVSRFLTPHTQNGRKTHHHQVGLARSRTLSEGAPAILDQFFAASMPLPSHLYCDSLELHRDAYSV